MARTSAAARTPRPLVPSMDKVFSPNASSVLLFIGTLVVFGVLSWLSFASNQRNNQRLLNLQTRDVGTILSTVVPTLQTPLASAAELAQATNGNRRQFRKFTIQYTRHGTPFDSVSLWSLRSGHPVELSIVGTTPVPIAMNNMQSMFARAARTSTIVLGSFGDANNSEVGYAYVAPGSLHNYAVFAEHSLPPNRLAPTRRGSAFSDLNYAIYLGATTQPASFLEASTSNLPLHGPTASTIVPFGASKITVVADPTSELGGSLSSNSWWYVALLGIVMAFIAAMVSERLMRRRQAAEHFADRVEQLYAQQRDVAIQLQQALLPEILPELTGIEVRTRYIPGVEGLEIGGDWYDALQLGDNRLLLVIGDVSGRGLNAATIMASLHYAIRAYALQGDSPAAIFAKLGNLVDIRRDHHFATVLCALVNTTTNEVTFVSAGHPPPLLRDEKGSHFVDVPVGPPIGVPGTHEYTSVSVTIHPGATLIGYTDGLTERRGELLDVGLTRLRDVVAESSTDRSLDDLLNDIISGLAPEGANDDIALLGLRWQ